MALAQPLRRGRSAVPTPSENRPEGEADTRTRLVWRGVELLTERGYLSTGLDDLLRSVGVPKGSFYHYFESKETFGLEALDAYAAYFARKLDRWLLDASIEPLDRIAAFVNDAGAGMERHGFTRGCAVGNLGLEVGELPEPFRQRLLAITADWESRLARCLGAARRAGVLRSSARCAELAAFFWIGWEGAVLRAKLERREAPLRTFFQGFRAALPLRQRPRAIRK